jgi:hypothetical protein
MKDGKISARAWIVMIVGGAVAAGCATDEDRYQVVQKEEDQYRVVQEKQTTVVPQPDAPAERPVDKPRTAPPPKPRSTPSPQEPTKRSPPAQESVKTIPPGPPPEEKEDARREAPPTLQQADKNGAQQHAKVPDDRVTPMDQSGSRENVDITRRIRRALMNEDLSFGAKNVLVITEDQRVVLKGTVSSPSEAERVRRVAAMMTTKPIDDRMEVERK